MIRIDSLWRAGGTAGMLAMLAACVTTAPAGPTGAAVPSTGPAGLSPYRTLLGGFLAPPGQPFGVVNPRAGLGSHVEAHIFACLHSTLLVRLC